MITKKNVNIAGAVLGALCIVNPVLAEVDCWMMTHLQCCTAKWSECIEKAGSKFAKCDPNNPANDCQGDYDADIAQCAYDLSDCMGSE